MKILFTITPSFKPHNGGVQRTTYNLATYFHKIKYEIAIFSFSNEDNYNEDFKVYSTPFNGNLKNSKNINYLDKIIREFKPDIIINQMPYEKPLRSYLTNNKKKHNYLLIGCLRNSLFSYLNNTKEILKRQLPRWCFNVVNNSLGIGLSKFQHWIRHRYSLKAILDQHDYFVIYSPESFKELQYFVRSYKRNKVVTIPNPVINEYLPKTRNVNEKIILHVGRLNVQQKRSDLIVPFWEKLYSELPDWNFVILGDGPYKDIIKKEITNKNLPRISLEGYQKPNLYYNKSSIFILFSAYEGFGNVLVEAQSYGVVPIAFNSYYNLTYIINDGKDGFACKPFDLEEMSNKVKELCGNDQMLNKMSENSFNNAQRFSIDKVGKKWEKLFKEKALNKAT